MDYIKSTDLMYYLMIEDIQDESKEFIGRELSDEELRDVKKHLSNGIHWDFYVRNAIETTLELASKRT